MHVFGNLTSSAQTTNTVHYTSNMPTIHIKITYL